MDKESFKPSTQGWGPGTRPQGVQGGPWTSRLCPLNSQEEAGGGPWAEPPTRPQQSLCSERGLR